MIQFVNAKLNLGLNIIRRREDGYHLLETVFYPVGIHNGEPCCPDPFCDVLEAELLPESAVANEYDFTGRKIDCPPEKNLVCRAAEAVSGAIGRHFSIRLCKHLPDGAGLGGGSADATFTLKLLNRLAGDPLGRDALLKMALSLGADCPVFVDNIPAYGEGIGEILTPVEHRLKGLWSLIVKPDVYISTREAFAGITPLRPERNALEVFRLPIERWRDEMSNDFESSIFPQHPQLAEVKQKLYASGAIYAQMSGSGSSLFGLYHTRAEAEKAREAFADLPTFISLLD